MTLPPLTYLTIDALSEPVARSQVLPYVELLATRGVDVTVHSFEKAEPEPEVADRLAAAGVHWRPHPFRPGPVGGLGRVAQAASYVARSELVHARSDLIAGAAVLTHRRAWVWDMRAFWREQRIALGMLAPGSAQDRTMRGIERAAARSSTVIVTLSHAAVDVLRSRYGDEVAAKCRVITTCVDLDRFAYSPAPPSPPVSVLLAGTLNALYDVPTMIRFLERLGRCRAIRTTAAMPGPSPWDGALAEIAVRPCRVAPAGMPALVSGHHVGLSMLRRENGVSNAGAMPTKLGEFLASGRPVVVNAGLGDMEQLLSKYDCGVTVQGVADTDLARAVDDLQRLLDDPGLARRCRQLAEDHFDLGRGVDELLAVYRDAVR